MRYNRARAEVVSKAAAQPAAEGDNNMVNISWRKLSAVFLFGIAVYFASLDTLMASKQSSSTGVELDRLIPREKWAGAGLDKLTGAEQQTLADDINNYLGPRDRQGTPFLGRRTGANGECYKGSCQKMT